MFHKYRAYDKITKSAVAYENYAIPRQIKNHMNILQTLTTNQNELTLFYIRI